MVNGLLFADLTARRVTRTNARRVARRIPRFKTIRFEFGS